MEIVAAQFTGLGVAVFRFASWVMSILGRQITALNILDGGNHRLGPGQSGDSKSRILSQVRSSKPGLSAYNGPMALAF